MNLPFGLDAQSIGDLLLTAFDSFGYLLTFIGALVENTVLLGLFLPGGSVILASAAYARMGNLQWPIVLLLGWTGTVLGNSLDYWLGRKALRPFLDRMRGRRSFVRPLAQARKLLHRHGPWAIGAGHFLGHLRSFIAIAAGSSRFPFGRYLLFELAAALAWNLLYCSLGYLLAAHLDAIRTFFERAGLFGLGAVILALLGFVLVRRFTRATVEGSVKP